MDEPASVAIRFALYLDLMLLLGTPAFGLYALAGPERASGAVLPFRRIVGLVAVVGIILSAVALLVLTAAMSGVDVADVSREAVGDVVFATTIGTAWQVRMAALLTAVGLSTSRWRWPRLGLGVASAAGAVALAALAWTGHGAAGEGIIGWVQLGSDIAHLIAAGLWIGALFAFVLLLLRRNSAMTTEHLMLTHRALAGFATVGTIVVGLIMVTGLVNSWILIGPRNVPALVTTLYGRLLLAKLALFAAMLGLAWVNRFRLTPTLSVDAGDHRAAARALRRSLLLEATAALGILLLVAWLGLLAPTGSGTD